MNYAKPQYTSRETTPRQRRIQDQRHAIHAAFNENLGIALGAILLVVAVLIFACI